jgi:hypothetical protein
VAIPSHADQVGREKVKQEISEAARLQKQIRDMELELARIKATHPPESVSWLVLVL